MGKDGRVIRRRSVSDRRDGGRIYPRYEGRGSFLYPLRGNAETFLRKQCGEDRIKISSSVDRRNKNEYYLKPFKKAIMEGGAEAVMTSYNEINGIPAIVNDEVRHVLKGTYGLPGHVVCDGGDFHRR